MSTLDEYANKYKTARMERRNGVLQVTLHTEGQSLRWGFLPHGELPEAFHDIGTDRENRVVILTRTGEEFSGPRATPGTSSFPQGCSRLSRSLGSPEGNQVQSSVHPAPAVSVAFAGPNLEYLYACSSDKIYRRKTKAKGALP